MSGALIQLVSKGVQDVYLNSEEGHSFFRMKFTRHTNFSQAPKLIKTVTDKDPTFTVPVLGDLVNCLWFEGLDKNSNVSSNLLYNSTIDLYIGGQKIDSQHYDYYADIWPNYLAETWTKQDELTNKTSTSNRNFQPLHFFFCDHGAFLPLISLAHHQVEVRVNFDQASLVGYNNSQKRINVYGNYVYLDKEERESLVKRQMDFIITQTQRLDFPLSNVVDNSIQTCDKVSNSFQTSVQFQVRRTRTLCGLAASASHARRATRSHVRPGPHAHAANVELFAKLFVLHHE